MTTWQDDLTDGPAEPEHDTEHDGEKTPMVDGTRLDALPIEGLVSTADSAGAIHAPAGDGVALCGRQVDGWRRRVETMPATARPCRDCFTDRVAEKYAPRDADIHGAVRDE